MKGTASRLGSIVFGLYAMFLFAFASPQYALAQQPPAAAQAAPAQAVSPEQTVAAAGGESGSKDPYGRSCTGTTCKFVFLAPLPIEGISGTGEFDLGGEGATAYVKGLYVFGVAVAAGLAVIMIVVGGIEMSTVDAMAGKIDGGGRKKINAALSGLALALLSYLILSTINVNLISSNFVPGQIQDVDESIGSGNGGNIVVVQGPVIGGGAYPPGFVGPLPDGTYTGISATDPTGLQGREVNARFTYFSSTERVNDKYTMQGLGAYGRLVSNDNYDPNIVGSTGSSYYPGGTIIARNINGNIVYNLIDDNNFGPNGVAVNNNVTNDHTFDIYTAVPENQWGKLPQYNQRVTIVSVPKTKLSASRINSLHDINNLMTYLQSQ